MNVSHAAPHSTAIFLVNALPPNNEITGNRYGVVARDDTRARQKSVHRNALSPHAALVISRKNRQHLSAAGPIPSVRRRSSSGRGNAKLKPAAPTEATMLLYRFRLRALRVLRERILRRSNGGGCRARGFLFPPFASFAYFGDFLLPLSQATRSAPPFASA